MASRKSLRTTLSDVARAAGVSVMTVSNVVRGKFVLPQNKARVEEAITRLNYRPNLSARSLRTSEARSMGIVIADSDPAFLIDPFISRLVSGLSNYLSSIDYTLDIQGVVPERFATAGILRKDRNDALCAILCGPVELRRQHLEFLRKLGQPVVLFQEVFKSPSPDVALIRQDDFGGGKLIGQLLLKHKVRRVVFLRPMLDWSAVEQREKGIRSICAAALPGIKVTTIPAASESFEDVYSTVQKFLSRGVPDAIVAATDSMGVAALKACESMGVEVPKRLIVTGFNGFDLWRYTRPTLTTVMSPAYEMGRRAGNMLIQRLRDGRFAQRNVAFPVTLSLADSTGRH
jgi:DNA-binding LacI/PurR family transcriptional regulator